MPDIFLSYSREDQTRARTYAEAFAAAGFEVWWDATLRSGEAYDQVTEKALRNAKAVVVLWSKKSVESHWVRAEATLADRNKTLVPCMIEPCERPIMFELTQTAELAHWKGEADDRAWQNFLADVRRFVEAHSGASGTAAPATTLAQIAAKPPPPREALLAVLPFDNLSSDAEMEFFSDGVSEEILGRLTRGSKLKVIGRTSSFKYRGADKPKAAEALNATHVLDGSIRRAGDQVRISAHLVEAATQNSLWSERYDRGLKDIFAVQDEISEAIAEALNTTFFPPRSTPIDPAVYDLYLRANAPDFSGPEAVLRKIDELEVVTRSAPDFAPAWAHLAQRRTEYRFTVPYAERAELRKKAEAEIARALALDPTDPDPWAVQWSLCNPHGDYLAQEKVIQSMLATGKYGERGAGIHALHLENVGRPRQAAEIVQRTYKLDPGNEFLSYLRGQTVWRAGQFAEGRAIMERTVATQPDNYFTRAALVQACAHGKAWEAVDALLDPDVLERYPLKEFSGIRQAVAVIRDPTEENRRAFVGAVRRRAEEGGQMNASALLYVAHLGHVDEAFEIAETISLGPRGTAGDFMGPNAYRTNLLFPAAYPEMRADPRFVRLCARLGLVEYWLETENWPDCAEVVPYDFKAECKKARDIPKDSFVF